MLRETILQNPFLYRVYIHLKGSKKIKVIASNSDIIIGGYPRSGNTFTGNICKYIFPSLEIAHHLHRIAPLKIMSKKAPVIILVRDPFNCISSFYVYRYKDKSTEVDMELLRQLCRDYAQYYNFVVDRKFVAVDFDDLISNPEGLIMIISRLTDSGYSKESISKAIKLHKTKKRNQTKLSSSLPNEEKEKAKGVIKRLLANMPELTECEEVFNKIRR